jgi:hypothetical protein
VQQLRFQGDEVRVGRVARALERHRERGLHMRRALREHIDSISKREGLLDVMGDKERRLGELLSGFEEPCVQLGAREGIERPEGLIEQQYLSLGEERADERDALAHPRRKLRRI